MRSEIIKSESGYTLVELLIAASIGSIVMLGMSTVMAYSADMYYVTLQRIEAEDRLLSLTYDLRLALSQAVRLKLDVGGVGLEDNTYNSNTLNGTFGQGTGLIRGFAPQATRVARDDTGATTSISLPRDRSDVMVSGRGLELLAAFLRENETGLANATSISAFQQTSIWFMRPTAATSGIVFLDSGAGGGNMRPDYSDPFYEYIQEIEFRDMQIAGGAASPVEVRRNVKSVELRAVTRIFLARDDGQPRFGFSFCPEEDILAETTDCEPGVPFRDIEKVTRIPIRNNLIGQGPNGSSVLTGRPLRVFGHLGFFKFTVPQIN